MLELRAVPGGVQLAVRAQPKASRDRVVGPHGAALKVAVTAAPTGGKANKAIEKVIAKAFGVRVSAVTVVAGHTSRDKAVHIDGLSEGEARAQLERVLGT